MGCVTMLTLPMPADLMASITVAKAPNVRAADGDPVIFGAINQGASTTFVLINSNGNATGLSVGANNAGTGLFASTPSGKGVHGRSDGSTEPAPASG